MKNYLLQQNYTWRTANYYSNSNYTKIANDLTTFLDILPLQTVNSLNVVAFCSASQFSSCAPMSCSTGAFFVPQLTNAPSVKTLSDEWGVYDTGVQSADAVYTITSNFLSSNLTFAQSFYSKVEFTQSCSSQCTANARGYIWYPLLSTHSAMNKKHYDTSTENAGWSVKYFTSSSSEDLASNIVQIFGVLTQASAFCSHTAIDTYNNVEYGCSVNAGYAGVLMPMRLQVIPDGSSLSGVWHYKEFTNTPENAFAALQNFTTNFTDAQLCYSKMALSMGADSNGNENIGDSHVSFWYQDLA